MIGGSYDGTTANMVAARSAHAPGLAGIVPIAAISRWYGYAYSDGIRYSGNSQRPTDEGADTPLGFDFGFGRTPPTDPTALDAARDRIRPCDADLHTQKGYDTSPDYDAFWLERDYRKDAERFAVPALIAHGWQDYNVKQEEGSSCSRRSTARRSRSSSCSRTATARRPTPPSCPARRVLRPRLKGIDTGIEAMPAVMTQGRTAAGDDAGFRAETSWPPAGTEQLALRSAAGSPAARSTERGRPFRQLHRPPGRDRGAAQGALGAEAQWLTYQTAPLAADTRIADAPASTPPSPSTATTASSSRRCSTSAPRAGRADHARLPQPPLPRRPRYREADPARQGDPGPRRVQEPGLDRQAGHRIALVLESSNSAWAVPDEPGLGVEVASGRLVLPVAP